MDPSEFDRWHVLAETDPAAYVMARRAAIEAMIERAPVSRQARLRALQDQVEMLRALTPDSSEVLRILIAMLAERVDAMESATSVLSDSVLRLSEAVHPKA